MRAVILPLLTTIVLIGGACRHVPPLEHTYASAAAVAEALLDAIHRRDRAALDAIALDESEFRRIWPYLPVARPERNLPFSYVWGDLHQKSTAAVIGTLSRHGGRRYRLLGIHVAGTVDYGVYRVHRSATFRVADGRGAVTDLRMCGSLIEQDGRWKVFSYLVD